MESRKTRILIADDNPAIRSAMTLLLENRLAVEVVAEADTMEGLIAAISEAQVDIIILDSDLPGYLRMNRVAVLRAVHPFMKIVLTSARPEIAQKMMAFQADAFVSKSEPPEHVVEVLESMVGAREQDGSALTT